MSVLLQVNRLHIELKKEKEVLVKEVTFTLEKGKSLVILGQSGSGKTMTCHAVMGLLEPKRFRIDGEILCEGKNLLKLSGREKRSLYGGKITMIPQNPMSAFDPSMKIGKQMEETLALHAGLRGRALSRKVLEALSDAGLPEPEIVSGSYPHTLSGGMLQRCMIAMALMTESKLIIADEPTTALDVIHRNDTVNALKKLRDEGAGILLVTHDFAVAKKFSDNLMIMKDGSVLEQGETEKILANPAVKYTKDLIEASRLSGQ